MPLQNIYEQVGPVVTKRLREAARSIRGGMLATVPSVIEIGDHLAFAKTHLKQDHFVPGTETEALISEGTAQTYMRVAEILQKNGAVGQLPPSVLYRLPISSVPETTIDAVTLIDAFQAPIDEDFWWGPVNASADDLLRRFTKDDVEFIICQLESAPTRQILKALRAANDVGVRR